MLRPTSALPPFRLANNTRRRRPLISLTPLIDVVFILLVFFMLTSTFLDWRPIELNAPGPTAARTLDNDSLLVEIRTDGLRLDGEAVTLAQLRRRIDSRLAHNPDQRVRLKPAAGVTLQRTVDVVELLTRAGAVNLALIRDHQR
jgi:biopolymer transport protein ExbD